MEAPISNPAAMLSVSWISCGHQHQITKIACQNRALAVQEAHRRVIQEDDDD
jgi:hypothetical protein